MVHDRRHTRAYMGARGDEGEKIFVVKVFFFVVSGDGKGIIWDSVWDYELTEENKKQFYFAQLNLENWILLEIFFIKSLKWTFEIIFQKSI